MKLSEIKKGLTAVNEDDKGGKKPTVTNQTRKDWNDYVSYLQTKGLRGHPSLDKNDMGGKMIDEYRKVNPTTTISRESIPSIQQDFSKYRDYSINELRNKRAVLSDAKNPNGRFVTPTENLDHYMKDLSIVDGIPGQRTTSHSFPESYLRTFENNKLKSTDNLGFATSK